ncbi:nucleoside recognition domain-containing protein [Bacillus sp. PBL-C9]|uniref:nucleoside recognition domain-containing protein n=1 Tax=Bacillus sp. PBL-C9 TaxID=3097548 RepID=UPI0039B7806D
MSIVNTISLWVIPCVIGFILLYGTIKKVPTYESFVEGGKEGIQIAISILPFMVGMLVSISIFRASGALDAMISVMKPMLDLIHVPAEIVPLALIRPISGSAGLSITTDLIATYRTRLVHWAIGFYDAREYRYDFLYFNSILRSCWN